MDFKIIYILSELPPYTQYGHNRTKISVDYDNNDWVGVFEDEWGVRLGNAVLKIDNTIRFEFWRPDNNVKTDFVYKLNSGLIYRAIPINGEIRKDKDKLLLAKLFELLKKENNYILHVGLNSKIFWLLKSELPKIPMIATSHGSGFLPINQIFVLRKNIVNYFKAYQRHLLFKSFTNSVERISYQTRITKRRLVETYKVDEKKLFPLTMGVDFNLFTSGSKESARKTLKISSNQNVLLTVCRLNERKQIDKLLEILSKKIFDNFKFCYIIVGNGDPKYVKYLQDKAEKLTKNNKVVFAGMKNQEELINYYNAADVFIQVAWSEAGPVTSMEALACETPVFTTNTGRVAEILNKNNSGKIVGTKNYSQWELGLLDYFNGNNINILHRSIAIQNFDWSHIAAKILDQYRIVAAHSV